MVDEALMTLAMIGGMIVLFIMGVPIAWAIGGITIFVSLFLWGPHGLGVIIAQTYGGMMGVSYSAIPLFVFMGVLLERSGIAEDLFGMLYVWSGRLRGGLALAVIIICMLFAAMSGLTAAACVTMGLIALPAMLKRGYNKDLALGCVVAPSTIGILIPPSVYMIILGVIGKVSVGRLFLGGMFPGLLLTFFFAIYVLMKGWLQPQSSPAISEQYSLTEKLTRLRHLILPLLIIASVLGTIMAGIATPTEAAALGCAALVISAALRRRLTWKVVYGTSIESFKITAFCMWIIFLALAFASTYIGLGGIDFFEGLLARPGMSPMVSFVISMVIIFIMGMFLDPFAIVMIMGPIVFPIMEGLGYDLVWVGVVFVVNICTSYITPPFGCNIFYLQAVAPPDVTTADIYHSIWPFLGIMLVGMTLMILFPEIVLWLPDTVMSVGR